MLRDRYQSLLSERFSPNRVVNTVTHTALAAGGCGLAVTVTNALGVAPSFINTPLRAAFAVAAYSALTAVVSFRSYGNRRTPPTNTPSA